jgi:hypothetical protein
MVHGAIGGTRADDAGGRTAGGTGRPSGETGRTGDGHLNSARDLTPSSAIPLAYFAFAHAGLATALAVLACHPDLPGAFVYHPRMIALVHLVTLAWLSGSILGAFYVVGPLALRLPMPVQAGDWAAFAAFAGGVTGMVSHFWMNEYDGMACAALLVVTAIGWVASRAWRGLAAAVVPWPVKLHVALAFCNVIAAAGFGMFIGFNRSRGWAPMAPLAATYAHAHLAAVGWVAMMVVGLGYRLIPMMLPAPMPTGGRLAASAVLIQAGLVVVVFALMRGSPWLPAGAALIAAGLVSFILRVRQTLRHRLPRPPSLPSRDWSVWQAHVALLWLAVATALGLMLGVGVPETRRVTWTWYYGTAGLLGFLAQMVVGIQGRLVPMYAWYRARAARDGMAPPRAAHALPSAAFARAIFFAWAAGVPLLAWGLAHQHRAAIAAAATVLLCGVLLGGMYLTVMLHRASREG